MFKNKETLQSFVKRPIAFLLAIIMIFSSQASAVPLTKAYAENKGDGGKALIDRLLEIVEQDTPYVWGGTSVGPNGGVDCRGFLRRAIADVYKNGASDIWNEKVAYLVDDNGSPVDGNGNPTNSKVWVDLAPYDALNTFQKYIGMRMRWSSPVV